MGAEIMNGSASLVQATSQTSARNLLSKRHIFSDDVRHQIQRLNKSDNYHGILLCLEDWVVILSMVALSLKTATLFPHNLLLTSAAYLLAITVIGSRMRALAVLAHDSSHGFLADNKHLNLFLGTVVTGWPIFQSWSGYYHSHVVGHHQNIGHPEKDPDFSAMIKTGLYDKDITKNDVIFYLLSIPTPWATILHVRYFFKNHAFPDDEAKKETFVRVIFWFIVVSSFAYFNALPTLVAFWIVPLFTTGNWFMAFLDVLEHYPMMTKGKIIGSNLHQSRNRFLSGFERFFFGIHDEGYHLVHHLWPRLPCWNMEKAHEIMMADSAYREIHRRPAVSLRDVVEDILEYFD